MDTEFPVFVALEDRSVRLVRNEHDLGWFERIDIEDGEYKLCWDRWGRPQQLAWHDGACVEPRSLPAEPSVVLEAIINWAESERVTVDFVDDPVVLWQRIDDALKQRWRKLSFFGKAARFLRGEGWGRSQAGSDE